MFNFIVCIWMHAHIGVHVCYCLPGRPEDSFRSWLSFHQVPPGINSGDPVRWEWGVRWSSSLGVRCQVLWQLLIFEEVSICSSLSVLKSFAVTVSTKEILQRNEKNTSHSLKKKKQTIDWLWISQRKTQWSTATWKYLSTVVVKET